MIPFSKKRFPVPLANPGLSVSEVYFERVYRSNLWDGRHSRSGRGSEGESANQKISILRRVIADYSIRSVLDIGSGDFHWMRHVTPELELYIGVDVVGGLIAECNSRYAGDKVSFIKADMGDRRHHARLPSRRFDLVVCFDLFGHLLNEEIETLLEFLLEKSVIGYLLVTNRRDEHSRDYLGGEKTREQGVDIEAHPVFRRLNPNKIFSQETFYQGDSLEMYALGE